MTSISCGDLREYESGTVEYYFTSYGPHTILKINKVQYNAQDSEVEYKNVNTPLYFNFPVELKPLQRNKDFYLNIYKDHETCIQLLVLVDGFKVDEHIICEKEEVINWKLSRSLFGEKLN